MSLLKARAGIKMVKVGNVDNDFVAILHDGYTIIDDI